MDESIVIRNIAVVFSKIENTMQIWYKYEKHKNKIFFILIFTSYIHHAWNTLYIYTRTFLKTHMRYQRDIRI